MDDTSRMDHQAANRQPLSELEIYEKMRQEMRESGIYESDIEMVIKTLKKLRVGKRSDKEQIDGYSKSGETDDRGL